MPTPSRDGAGSWTITEENAVFRIVDAAGRIVAEIPFADRSPANLSRTEARRMAEDMLATGDMLEKYGKRAEKPQDF